jgi:NADP-dependent aldehyde dehydrogenase
MLMHKHLIAGQWVDGRSTFASAPARGNPESFAVGTPEDVNAACAAAEEAFWSFGYSSGAERARLLDAIADEIEARGDEITLVGSAETGLPEARLEGERGRTTGQLRMFARLVEAGAHLDSRHDAALPDRQPMPRPDLRLVQRPVGPVAVFGASNFPLAFSVAGGDTASALAAGCPVVVKGHSAHPGTGDLVAQAVHAAITSVGVHPGVFSLVQGGNRAVGQALVTHPLVRAVGFTGSLAGGRALFDLCASRPEPVPFFGELGSVNPMFCLPSAIAARGAELAEGWAASLVMGAGQFCTNPGIAVVIAGAQADAFVEAVAGSLSATGEQVMLTDGIARAYRDGRDRLTGSAGVEQVLTTGCEGRVASPNLLRTSGKAWLENEALGEEVFGPLGLVVTVEDVEEMRAVAESLKGQLTCTLHLDEGDTETARQLMPVLERKAGRVLCNGFPTGVEVCDAMVHGGPYPASTNFGHTSVGTMAIRRWLRPVCYQNVPGALLPGELRD